MALRLDQPYACGIETFKPYSDPIPTVNMLPTDSITLDTFQENVLHFSELQNSFFPNQSSGGRVNPQVSLNQASVAPCCEEAHRPSAIVPRPPSTQEFEVESNILSGMDIEYSLIENDMKKENDSSQPACVGPVSTLSKASVQSDTHAPAPAGAPLLEPEFSFYDILGVDAIPVESHKEEYSARPEGARADVTGVHAPITNEELSNRSVHADTDMPSGFAVSPTYIPEMEAGEMDTAINSPVSGSSITEGPLDLSLDAQISSHPDQYENLPPHIRNHVDRLREKISLMPRRKLRESLALVVTLEDVEPLMFVNRDELASMLGLGVTTWKTFMHSLGVPRWPARALKSQQVKESKVLEKMEDAEKRGDMDGLGKLAKELSKLKNSHQHRKRQLRNNATLRVSSVSGGVKKKGRHV